MGRPFVEYPDGQLDYIHYSWPWPWLTGAAASDPQRWCGGGPLGGAAAYEVMPSYRQTLRSQRQLRWGTLRTC